MGASFAVIFQTVKVMATVPAKCLVRWKGITFVGGRCEPIETTFAGLLFQYIVVSVLFYY